jgi:hypothetical protein
MRREKIATPAESVVGFRALVPVPSHNPSLGSTFEICGLPEAGYLLELRDPAGALVWRRLLVGSGEPAL